MSKLPSISPARKAAAWAAASTLAFSPIAEHEGLRLTRYQDVAKVWTECYGETAGVTAASKPKTKAYCDTRLARSIKAHADDMQKCVHVDVPVKSLVGLISFGYNVGAPKFCGSTLVVRLNEGNLKAACDQLPKWVYAGGIKWNGLVTRRSWEQRQCLSGLEPAA